MKTEDEGIQPPSNDTDSKPNYLDHVDNDRLAREFGVHPRTICRWQDRPNRGMPYRKPGAKRLSDLDAVRQWMAEERVQRNPRKKPKPKKPEERR